MQRYFISICDKNNNAKNFWTIANSEEEAINNIKDGYWDEFKYKIIGIQNI